MDVVKLLLSKKSKVQSIKISSSLINQNLILNSDDKNLESNTVILAANSPYFDRLINGPFSDVKDNIELPFDIQYIQLVIEHMHSDTYISITNNENDIHTKIEIIKLCDYIEYKKLTYIIIDDINGYYISNRRYPEKISTFINSKYNMFYIYEQLSKYTSLNNEINKIEVACYNILYDTTLLYNPGLYGTIPTDIKEYSLEKMLKINKNVILNLIEKLYKDKCQYKTNFVPNYTYLFLAIRKLIHLGFQYDYSNIISQITFSVLIEYIENNLINVNVIKDFMLSNMKNIKKVEKFILIDKYILLQDGMYGIKQDYTCMIMNDDKFNKLNSAISQNNYDELILILISVQNCNLGDIDSMSYNTNRIVKLSGKDILFEPDETNKLYIIKVNTKV